MTLPAPPFEVCAPGKLVLVGEYAVVDGGPALVLAIGALIKRRRTAEQSA